MEFLFLLLVVPFLFSDLFSSHDDDEEEPAPDIVGTDAGEWLEGTTAGEEIRAGAGDDEVTAWAGDDTVTAGDGLDFVLGETGNDLIFGGAGADLVDGGAGNDTIWLGDGDDLIADDGVAPAEFDTGPEGDDQISGGNGNDVLLDWVGANTLTGELGNDWLFGLDEPGTEAADSLSGGWGFDTIGGDDGDTMSGGGFDDAFVVVTDEPTDSAVTITDFDGATEELYLDFDQDRFEGLTGDDLTMATDPASGDVTVSLAGQEVVVLTAPVNGFAPSNVILPEWMRPAAA